MQEIIALINDNKIFSDLFYYSTLYGYRFKITGSTEEALACFAQHRASVFVVECADTEQHFLKFVRHLAPSAAVIAVCTGKIDEEIAIQAFINGADSVLPYLCGSREFYYRLRNFLRILNLNTGQESVQFITLGALKIYPQNNQVILNDDFVPLTSTEFKLLMLFVNKLNQTVPNEELYLRMYETDDLQYTSRVLSVHISKLRRKLKLAEIPELELKISTAKVTALHIRAAAGTEMTYETERILQKSGTSSHSYFKKLFYRKQYGKDAGIFFQRLQQLDWLGRKRALP